MKSAEAWASELGIPDDIDSSSIELIQADATADLQSQVEQLVEDGAKSAAAADEAEAQMDKLRTALEKCVVALEWIKNPSPVTDLETESMTAFFEQRDTMIDDAIATAKPLLNKP